MFFLLVTAGCGPDYGLGPRDDGSGAGTEAEVPDITVDPGSWDFGELAAGETASTSIRILNDGDESLFIANVVLEDADAPYDIGPLGTLMIPPGQATEFSLEFLPATGVTYDVNVLIDSNDPDEPTVAVPITGLGIAPIVDLAPEDYDFGSLYIGCDAQLPITLSNIGNDVLVVDDVEYSTGSDDFVLVDDGDDWELDPFQSVELWVDYAPLDEYQDIAYLQVYSNDVATPIARATQSGMGALAGEQTDVFEQPLNGATDILFALDLSGSMGDNIDNVETNFGVFVSTLASMDADYHVAVVTADDGCISYPAGTQPWIDNTMALSEQQDVFDAMVNEGGSGSNTERGFMLLEAALKSSNIGTGGCNEGFYREDASLALVGVSDEPEQSTNPYGYYVSLFQGLKEDSDDVVMHAIGGDYPGGCGTADPYAGFYEATVATGGVFLSICATDFGSHLETLAASSAADLSSFQLTDTPVPETLEVNVNGIPTTIGWSYVGADNEIVFEDDHVPEGGSTIAVTYALYGDCEG